MIFSGVPAQLVLAFLVDSLIGDPRWIPHPVRCIGEFISWLEGQTRKFGYSPVSEKVSGGIVVSIVVVTTYLVTYLFTETVSSVFRDIPILNIISLNDMVIALAGSMTIALRGLRESAENVLSELRRSDLDSAREQLGHIVGRDTEGLNREGILRATVETLSENVSDGVIAPMFYFAIGGLPLAMAYKAINTLDSMLGYKNERYINFGYVAARLDDIANYIPARLTAWTIIFSAAVLSSDKVSPSRAVRVMLRDGRKHSSPNAGLPEAAMAGALGIQLGGPSSYEGVVSVKPFIGEGEREIELEDGAMADRIIKTAGGIGMILCVMLSISIHRILIIY
ncbi:Adenosylcobinamide-phosphate synthase [hydrothermal vent metagenome]|uniref:Adenosylcobinamide-phosphate synthase n=1 Tax=hydrothermal vent metagenome TaxID=652676 RepID=A0A3B1DN06_9ZZZZ